MKPVYPSIFHLPQTVKTTLVEDPGLVTHDKCSGLITVRKQNLWSKEEEIESIACIYNDKKAELRYRKIHLQGSGTSGAIQSYTIDALTYSSFAPERS